MISQDSKQAMRNPWVLGWLGLLVTVVVVNVIFIVTAFKTNPGLVTEDYYEKGRYHDDNYDKRLETRNRLGWHVTQQVPAKIIQGKPTNYSVSILDKVGNPLKGASVTLHAYRPSDANADYTTEMGVVADGVFQSQLLFPLKGKWEIFITIKQGEEVIEEPSKTIHVLAG